MEFVVYSKEIKTKAGKTFITRFTKNNNNVSFRVHINDECENKNLIPNNTKPFILYADGNNVSCRIKKEKLDDDRVIKKPILYFTKIEKVEEYKNPEFTAKDFNSIDESIYEEEELPF